MSLAPAHPFAPTIDDHEVSRAPGGGTRSPRYGSAKAVLDRVLAGLMLVPATPVIALTALLVRLTSPGPPIYRQVRVGRRGRPFTLFKIRTMAVDSERNGAQWSTPGDPRVTGLGKFLRRTHLDELPQLWNVLHGDMSLLGPRPERPEFVVHLATAIPCYDDRHRVLPGVTGFAQVQLPADTDLESVRRKLGYDLWYIRHQSLWLDVRLVLATGLKLFGVSFYGIRGLLRLPPPDVVEQYYRSLPRPEAGLTPEARAGVGQVPPCPPECPRLAPPASALSSPLRA